MSLHFPLLTFCSKTTPAAYQLNLNRPTIYWSYALWINSDPISVIAQKLRPSLTALLEIRVRLYRQEKILRVFLREKNKPETGDNETYPSGLLV
ncbi:MAG TPA: hypothetical protein PKW42_07400, partial [bacterium]|nr:hypothetical protein [bacterium]